MNPNEINLNFPDMGESEGESNLFYKWPSLSESLKDWASHFRHPLREKGPSELDELMTRLDDLSQRPIQSIFQF